ncbi:M4 family metallopeptidase [Lacinutrix neustonica]|uniref:Neutral metalloproteinase n=1 Tax=Lacinutrix neustonica TaxID=2980107 RepID=A0A9E8SF01_9FLAO|nr:M4 family metallopeptidase [Lacinutrix neustonica]WAC03302.1 M4 family metallopeptidase [Lacinutrix neustonica]
MKILKLLAICLLFTSTVFAQNLRKSISDFQTKTKASVTINSISGVPEFIMFKNNNTLKVEGATLNVKAFNFLETNKRVYGINDVNVSFGSLKIQQDTYSSRRVVLQQLHDGVPVYDGKLLFHFNKQKDLTAINGNYIPNIKINAVPNLSKEEAQVIALQDVYNQEINYSGASLLVHDTKLYVFNKGLAGGIQSANYLVYEVEVRNNSDVREFLFVDAHSGVVIEQYTGIAHALDRTIYENNTGNTVWQEGDAFPASLTIWQQNEVVASGHAYHFFNNAFGYASYDGADAPMRTVNNDPNISCPNANWNGSTANYCDGTAADDVIAHEWGHAYTGGTSGLIYQWQSGAINESYSDIWGETIDLLNSYEDGGENNAVRTLQTCGESNRWKIGEDATAFGGNIRDMWNPTCKGDPGKVTDGQYLCGTTDSGGVHINCEFQTMLMLC